MHEVLLYSVQKSDTDLRKVLYQNIVLSGGSTLFKVLTRRLLQVLKIMCHIIRIGMCFLYCIRTYISYVSNKQLLCVVNFQGFGDRLLSEIRKMAPKDIKIKVRRIRILLLIRILKCAMKLINQMIFFIRFQLHKKGCIPLGLEVLF
jgi:hypothetical protein